ncbi:MAG: hypothetical protein Hens3KO_18590 [Henriciella sp.]
MFERGPVTNLKVIPGIYDYPEKGTLSYKEVIANAPSPFQNQLNVALLYDESWVPFVRPAWSLWSYARSYPELRSYSHTEIRCWAALGDQLANELMADFYFRLAYDLEEGFEPQDLDDWQFPKTPEAARALQISHLLAAAETPDSVQLCEELGETCPYELLTPFPLGLPDAHWSLMWIGRRNPELVLNGTIKSPEHHFRLSLQGGSYRAYYAHYEIAPPTL